MTGDEALEPCLLVAVIGKHVVPPDKALPAEERFRPADFAPYQRVLEPGCGVRVPAIDISPSAVISGVKSERRADPVGHTEGTGS